MITPKDYLMSILEGLEIEHKKCKILEFLGSCNKSEIELDGDGSR